LTVTGVTFYDHAARARRNSRLLLIGAVALATGAGAAIGAATAVETGVYLPPALIGALVGTSLGLLAALFASSGVAGSFILRSLRAREVDAHPNDPVERQLRNIVRELCVAAALPVPRLYVIEEQAINALATGGSPEQASIAVTTGALDALDREELTGVIAHELAHVRNYDIRFGLYLAGVAALFALLADLAFNMLRGTSRVRSRSRDGGGVILVILGVAAVCGAIGSIGLLLIRAASSRNRELLADASAVELARNPDGLARALAKIHEASDRTVDTASSGSAHLFFTEPRSGVNALLSTHPLLLDRINALRALAGRPLVDEASLAAELSPPRRRRARTK
jgi:heat shock protein HtpX